MLPPPCFILVVSLFLREFKFFAFVSFLSLYIVRFLPRFRFLLSFPCIFVSLSILSFLFIFFKILPGLLSMFLPLLSGIPGTSPLLRFSLPSPPFSLSRLFRGLVSLALIFLHSLLCIREGSFYTLN